MSGNPGLYLAVAGVVLILAVGACEGDSEVKEPESRLSGGTSDACAGGDTLPLPVDSAPVTGCLNAGRTRLYTFEAVSGRRYTVLAAEQPTSDQYVEYSVFTDSALSNQVGENGIAGTDSSYFGAAWYGAHFPATISGTHYVRVVFDGTFGQGRYALMATSNSPTGTDGGDLGRVNDKNAPYAVDLGAHYIVILDDDVFPVGAYLAVTTATEGWHVIKAVFPSTPEWFNLGWNLYNTSAWNPADVRTDCRMIYGATMQSCLVRLNGGYTYYLEVTGTGFLAPTISATVSLIAP